MPVQTQQVDLAAMFGGRLSGANEQHKDKPVDKGFQDLPAGIKNGVAQLKVMIVEPYKDDKMGEGTKGKPGFRASAVVVFSGNANTPSHHDGIKVVNMQTTMFASLCDIPAKGNFPAVTLEQNWEGFINIFKMFGVVCPETKATDPNGVKTWAFYKAAMQALTDPKKPRYVSFSTSYYKRPQQVGETKEAFEARKGKVYQNWHGEVEWKGVTDPTQLVNLVQSNGAAAHTQPTPHDNPPEVGADGLPLTPDYSQSSPEDLVAALLAQAKAENPDAQEQLVSLAKSQGWPSEVVDDLEKTWDDIANMALNPPDSTPTVGSKWNYCKRDKNGNKLTDDKGVDLPSKEIEVVTVDEANKTVTAKYTKDGMIVKELRSRTPTSIKWEWLE